MLSSISSFLPSALQIGNDKSPPPQEPKAQITESPTKDDETEDMAIDEHGVKKKKERTNEVSRIHNSYYSYVLEAFNLYHTDVCIVLVGAAVVGI